MSFIKKNSLVSENRSAVRWGCHFYWSPEFWEASKRFSSSVLSVFAYRTSRLVKESGVLNEEHGVTQAHLAHDSCSLGLKVLSRGIMEVLFEYNWTNPVMKVFDDSHFAALCSSHKLHRSLSPNFFVFFSCFLQLWVWILLIFLTKCPSSLVLNQ